MAMPEFLVAASMAAMPGGITSLPIPSPAMMAILWVAAVMNRLGYTRLVWSDGLAHMKPRNHEEHEENPIRVSRLFVSFVASWLEVDTAPSTDIAGGRNSCQ